MRRFYIEKIIEKDNTCIISGSEARHITRVLRMGRGDRFVLMDGERARFQAVIDTAGHQEVLVTLERPLPAPPSSPVDITLCQSLLKSRPMDYVIQKTSELGVDHIFPFSSERTVARLDDNRSASRVRHWREITQSATKQSDRVTPAEIVPILSIMELTGQWKQKDALKVILWEEEGSRDLKGLLRASSPAKSFVGIVGPEGGFSREEVEIVKDAGFISVSMGRRILRAETAAITMVAIVQYEWGDLSLNEE
jgi:16S rRNA (uracil1498-N3)-methyltransferase